MRPLPLRTVLLAAFSLLLSIGAPSVAWAQASANKAELVGTVLDPNGAAIPGAKIRVVNVATGFNRDLTSTEAGQYRAVAIDPGRYDITATAQGFAETKLSGVVVTVGSAITLDIPMSVQATTTTIEVGETLISDVQTSPAATVNSNSITNLPINGRRFQDFAQLTPTVVATSGTRNQLSFAGQRGINSNVMLDGGDYNQPFFGGIRGGERSGTIITVPQSAIQEFQVVTTGYTAEYGRSTGGVMNTITKSGANEIHGEGFWQVRHRELSAQNPIPINIPGQGLTKVTPSETLYQYGGSVGGAIKKNKLFWFAAAENQNATTPRQVFFAPLSNLTPTPATQEGFNLYRGFEGPFDQTNRATALMGKLDYQFERGHRLTARYNWSDSIEKNALSVGGDLNPFSNAALSNEGQELDTIHNGALQFTAILSPSMVNDFRFLGSAEVRPRLANESIPGLNATLIGQYGTRSFFPTTQSDKRWQFADALSITSGKHTFKIGADYNYLTASQAFGFNQFGFFTVSAPNITDQLDILGTGGTIANRFDSPFVSYSRQIGNTLASFDMHQLAFFLQDSYRVNRALTLDFGLRYEAQFNPAVEANNDAILNQVENVRFPLGVTFDPRSIKDAPQQWMPRFGFAWTPFQEGGRTVIRGNMGIFYAATPMLSFAGPNNNFRTPPGDVSLTITPTGGRTIYQAFQAAGLDLNSANLAALPLIPIEVVQRASAFMLTGSTTGSAANPFNNASVIGAAADFANPRSYQGGLGIETELTKGWTFGVQFNYINTVRLQRNRNYNLQAPILIPGDASQRPNFRNVNIAGGQPTVPRPVPGLNQITIRDSSARQMYRSMVLQSQYRKRRLQIQAFYTLAENFSDDDSERDAGGFTYTNSFNLRDEYGYSNLDIRHSFVANGVYTLPWGFEIGAIGRYRTGTPIDARANLDVNQDGNNNDRPYRGPGLPFRRNEFRNRSFKTFDLRVLKNINLGERLRVQISAEMFNLFNFENVVFAGQSNIYGQGFLPNGGFAPIDSRFLNPLLPNGDFNANTTEQLGRPLQAQFGVRLFF
jgi:hypothetical protein